MAPVTRNNAKPSDRQEQETLWTKRQTLPAKTYRNQVFEFLKHHYSKISVSCIRQTLKHHGHSFTASYRTLDRINRLTQEDVPPRQLEDRIRREFPFLSPTSSIVIQRRRSSPHPMLSNQELLDEIDGVDELNQKENRKENRKGASVCVAEGMVRENDRGPFVPVPPPVAASIPSVTSLSSPFSSPTAAFKTPAKKPDEMEVECQCCYGDFPFEIMVHCNNGHLFCSACLRSHVSEELFGNNRDSFKCMSMDGCTEGFEDMMLDKALTPRIRKKTGEHIYRAEIAKLQLDDLW